MSTLFILTTNGELNADFTLIVKAKSLQRFKELIPMIVARSKKLEADINAAFKDDSLTIDERHQKKWELVEELKNEPVAMIFDDNSRRLAHPPHVCLDSPIFLEDYVHPYEEEGAEEEESPAPDDVLDWYWLRTMPTTGDDEHVFFNSFKPC